MNMQEHLKNNIRPAKHSETLLINQVSQMRLEKRREVYKFGFGQSPFPVPNKIVNHLSNAAHRKEYMSVQGHAPLRKAIVNFHAELENKNWDESQIIVGAGSKILIYCIMAAFEKADILLPAPSWVSYEPQAVLSGHKVDWLSTSFENQWLLTPEVLEEYCLKRKNPNIPLILVFNYPSNPSGQSYSSEQLNALAKVMRKHKIIVIADEIYSLLNYQKNYQTLDNYYPEACIVSSGLSKWCGAGGWRLGFHHIPKQLGQAFLQAVIGVASETYSCAPSPIQIAATEAYENISLAKIFLMKQVALLKVISRHCSTTLRKSGVKVHDAKAGFYLFPDFSHFRTKLSLRNIHSGEQLTTTLMEETGVALLPGSAFGMTESSLTTRLAFVDFDGSQIWQETNSEAKFDKVKEGIERLCEWLETL